MLSDLPFVGAVLIPFYDSDVHRYLLGAWLSLFAHAGIWNCLLLSTDARVAKWFQREAQRPMRSIRASRVLF